MQSKCFGFFVLFCFSVYLFERDFPQMLTINKAGVRLVRSWDIDPGPPTWVAGSQGLALSSAASQGVLQQEAESEVEPGLKPRHYNKGCKHPKLRLITAPLSTHTQIKCFDLAIQLNGKYIYFSQMNLKYVGYNLEDFEHIAALRGHKSIIGRKHDFLSYLPLCNMLNGMHFRKHYIILFCLMPLPPK